MNDSLNPLKRWRFTHPGVFAGCRAAVKLASLAVPVLAADIPANRSLVHDNRTGWLYRNEADFKALVVRLAGDPALREQVGGRAREYVLTNFPPGIRHQQSTT